MTLASIAAKSSGSQELALAKSAKTMCSLKRSSYQTGAFVLPRQRKELERLAHGHST